MATKFTLSAPASASNMGPGFDTLGMAFGIRNEFTFETGGPDDSVVIDGTFAGKDNLVYTSLKLAYKEILNLPFKTGLKISCVSRIPVGAGLGSSASCVVAGVAAAFLLADRKIDPQAVFEISSRIEEHPDNAAAAVFGGFTISVGLDEPGRYRCARYPVPKNMVFCAAIPDRGISTLHSRAALPAFYKRESVVYNIGHASLTAAAYITGDVPLLRIAGGDRIHEPFRLPVIAGAEKAAVILSNAGAVTVFLSGSGPAVIGVSDGGAEGFLTRVGEGLARLGDSWKALPLVPDEKGLVITI